MAKLSLRKRTYFSDNILLSCQRSRKHLPKESWNYFWPGFVLLNYTFNNFLEVSSSTHASLLKISKILYDCSSSLIPCPKRLHLMLNTAAIVLMRISGRDRVSPIFVLCCLPVKSRIPFKNNIKYFSLHIKPLRVLKEALRSQTAGWLPV